MWKICNPYHRRYLNGKPAWLRIYKSVQADWLQKKVFFFLPTVSKGSQSINTQSKPEKHLKFLLYCRVCVCYSLSQREAETPEKAKLKRSYLHKSHGLILFYTFIYFLTTFFFFDKKK